MDDQWQQIKLKTIGITEKVARVAAVKIGTLVIQDTPVLSGQLRNNWFSVIDGTDYKEREPNASGSESLYDLRIAADEIALGVTLFFFNPMPYANRIEYEGYSQKAPSGMVRINTANWQQIVDQARRELKE